MRCACFAVAVLVLAGVSRADEAAGIKLVKDLGGAAEAAKKKGPIVQVLLQDKKVADADVKVIAESFPKLQELNLRKTGVGDEAMTAIKTLTDLERLNLSFTKVTDAGMKDFGKLAKLKELWLSDTEITDTGVKELKGLPLKDMKLDNLPKVTDASVETLKGLTDLKSLTLIKTGMTKEGADAIQKALPKSRVTYIK